VVKMGVGWLEQKLLSRKVGVPNESYILQDNCNATRGVTTVYDHITSR
jgi:hypothetical protein